MKKPLKISVLLVFIYQFVFNFSFTCIGQIPFDPEDNLYEITAYWDNYYDSIINHDGIEALEGTDYKFYLHWKNEWEPRVQPSGDFLPYLQAIEDSYECFDSLGYFDLNGTWFEIGPVTSSNQGTDDVGRLSCLEIDPANDSKILCGSPVGGLYYTENKGASWINAGLDRPKEVHGLNMFTPGIASIIISNYNNETYWIVATGDKDHNFKFSRGVLRTKDKGEHWDLINGTGNNSLPENWYYIRKLIQHPQNPNVIFAATSMGLFKTENALAEDAGDVVWELVYDDQPITPDPGTENEMGFFDIEFHKTNYDTMFMSIEYRGAHKIMGNEIIYSEDGGNNWNPLSGAGQILPVDSQFDFFLSLLELTNANPDLMYVYVKGTGQNFSGYYNKILKYVISTGQWSVQNENPPFAFGNGRNGLAVSPVNENLLQCATIDTYLSNDGGVTWIFDNNYFTLPNTTYSKKCPHSDVQDLKYNSTGTELWAASDGGPFMKYTQSPDTDWQNMVNNIGVAIIHYFDQSKIDPNYYVFGGFDVHSQLFNKNENIWSDKSQGDGYGCAFDNEELGKFYVTNVKEVWRYENWTNPYFKIIGENWNRHVKLHPENHEVLYMTLLDRIARSYDQGTTWETLVSLEDLNTNINDHFLYDMHTAEGDGDYLYLRMIKKANGNGDFSRIYKTTNVNESDPALIEWSQLPIPQGGALGWMGDIIVDYENPDRIWVCYNQESDYKILEFNGTEWTDLTFNIAPCNTGITSLEHLHGTNRGLFANGLHGVFYLEDGSNIWKLYKPGIPNVPASYLKINYCTGKIVAGTYGRGIWETDLPLGWDNPPVITTNETWDGYRVILNPVHIPDGKTLTINGKVAFTANGKLVVERGGQLILNGAYLTNTCGEMWKGVEVWGNPNLSHSLGNQGKVLIVNGTLIEHALAAVRTVKVIDDQGEGEIIDLNFSGGIVQSSNSEFRNNKNAVIFYKYPATGLTHQSTSFFSNCDFVTDDFYEGLTGPDYFVRMSELNVTKFNYCRFSNESSTNYTGGGIYSYNSQYSIEGRYENDTWLNGEFNKLNYGIYATGNGMNRHPDIRHTNFIHNYRGLYQSGINYSRTTSNYFEIYTPWEINGGYGMYLDHCSRYWVEDNEFIGKWIGNENFGVGLIVNRSGGEPNQIYLNRFNRLQCGIEAQNENRAKDGTGLVLKCNNFLSANFDQVITYEVEPMNKQTGIASNQGSIGSIPSNMAGNLFDIDDEIPNGDFDDINNEGNSITYYWPSNYDPLYWNVKPVDFTELTVHLEDVEFDPDWTTEIGCPPTPEIGIGGGTGTGEIRDQMTISEQKIDSTENILSLLVDGGNTDELQTEVDNSVPPEAMEVYSELISKSPYLSDTVVSTAIEKENVLPGAMIRDVMVANPNTAKSNELMNKLDERWTPLPDYMKAQILQGKNIVSVREQTESKLAAYKIDKSIAFNALTRYFLADTLNHNTSDDSITQLFLNDNQLNSKYNLAFLHLEHGSVDMGQYALVNIPVQFELTSEEEIDRQQMINLYGLIALLDGNHPDSVHIQALLAISAQDAGLATVYARNILISFGEMQYEEPILMPDLLKSSKSMEEYNTLINSQSDLKIKVVPNPSKDYIIVEYELESLSTGQINIFDVTGKPIFSVQTTNPKDQVTIDTRGWKPGVYVATLMINSKAKKTVKFTIID
jgi:hypothetical protein